MLVGNGDSQLREFVCTQLARAERRSCFTSEQQVSLVHHFNYLVQVSCVWLPSETSFQLRALNLTSLSKRYIASPSTLLRTNSNMGTPANKASLRNELGHKIQANNSRQDVNGDDTTDHPDVELSSLAGVKVETQPTLNAQRFLDDEIADFSSTLEGLPSELRIEILMFMPDLPTLRACVYSSPVMHEQYKSNRDRILRACLYRELDGLVIDSYALVMSRVSVLGSPRTDEKIIEFLESYKSWFSEPDTRPDMYSLTPRFVRWLAAFQLRVVRPLTRSYITWAFANLKNAVSPSMSRYMGYAADKEETAVDREPDIEINRSEVIRIQRALYRHEIFHRLFGRNAGKRYTGGFRDYFVNHVFFDMFDPWETEAIGCIDIFVREKYVDMFKQVEDDLCRLNPSLRGYVGGHPNREVPTFVVETQHGELCVRHSSAAEVF